MSLLSTDKEKEKQRINELERRLKREKAKLDKKRTKQKILLGAFLIEMLEKDSVTGIRSYTANNLNDFLTRKTDKDLMSDIISNLKSQINTPTENENINSNGFNYDKET